MSKTASKKKQTAPQSRKKKSAKQAVSRQSSTVSKEIIGLSLVGIGLLVLIGVFTEKSGFFGLILRQIFIGLFGIGGYIIPISAILIGIFYIQGDFEKVLRSSIFIGSFTLLLMIFFHTLSYGEDMSISLLSAGYMEEAYWSNGGYIGAALAYLFLKLLGLYGTYIVLGVLVSIWVLTLTDFPIFSWLYQQGEAWAREKSAERIQAKKRHKQLREEKTRKISNAASEEEPPIVLNGYEEDFELETETENVADISYGEVRESEEPPSITALPPKVYEPKLNVVASEESTKVTKGEMGSSSNFDKERASLENSSIPYEFPPVSLLNKVQAVQNKEVSRKSLSNAHKLEETLASFGVEAKVTQISRGPAVTRYELQPKQGVKVSKIVNLADDIALNLAAPSIRIEAPIPGKAAVGIEVANESSEVVYLRDVIDSDRFLAFPSKLAFALGKILLESLLLQILRKCRIFLLQEQQAQVKVFALIRLLLALFIKPDQMK